MNELTQPRTIFDADRKGTRRCGDCQLCCKLLPVRSLKKKASERCKYQKVGKGCMVYQQPGFPVECHVWSCRWLLQEAGTENMHRPDRAHYCLDVMPDYVTIVIDGSERINVEVIQIWCDPGFPDAHRDPALRAYLESNRLFGLVRFNESKAIHLMPPFASQDRKWHEIKGGNLEPQHTPEQLATAAGLLPRVTVTE